MFKPPGTPLEGQGNAPDSCGAGGRRLFQAIVEGLPQGVAVFEVTSTDPEDLRLVYMNPASARVLGPSDARGLSIRELATDEAHAAERREAARMLYEVAMTGAPGMMALKAGRGAPYPRGPLFGVPIERGTVAALCPGASDQTGDGESRPDTPADPQEMARHLASIGTLAAGLGHEINNPLSYILANLEFAAETLAELKDDELGLDAVQTQRLGQFVHEARDGAERVRRLVSSLRTLTPGDDADRALIDVHAAIEAAIEAATPALPPGVRLTRRYASPPAVFAPQARLVQVFAQLLVNAGEALVRGDTLHPEIIIETAADGASAAVDVRDNGPGIPDHHRHRVFDPFFTTKGVGSGVGLGLTICHRIVTGLGGSLQTREHPGGGAVLSVRIPAHRDRPDAASGRADDHPVVRTRVLLVEDEPLLRTALRRILSRHHDVDLAKDGREAIEALEDGREFDAIVCDLLMPRMTGMELYQSVCEQFPRMKPRMVFITGGAATPEARQFLDTITNPAFTKPVDLSALLEALRDITG